METINDKNKILNDPILFEFAPDFLKKDKEFVLKLNEVCRNKNLTFSALKFADDSLRSDYDFIKTLCTYSEELYSVPWFSELEFASDNLKNNKELVLCALNQNPIAFWYASEELQNDKEFILSFISQSCSIAFVGASRKLQTDREFIKQILAENGFVLSRFEKQSNNAHFKDDKELVLIAVKEDGDALKFASNRLKKDRDVVITAVKRNQPAIEYAHKSLSNDKEIMKLAGSWSNTIGNWNMD